MGAWRAHALHGVHACCTVVPTHLHLHAARVCTFGVRSVTVARSKGSCGFEAVGGKWSVGSG
eukprot:10290125-Alexandrium_andersonii.AAC.1